MAWDAEAARDRLQQFVIERCGDPAGIGVWDETGVPKQGTRSVGVAKPSCGALGKLENGQVATLLTYATAQGHVFLDRRLFLPEAWCQDAARRARRARAQVPEEGPFQTKPEQAQAMLEPAWQPGVPMRWVTGDSVSGDSPGLRAAMERAGKRSGLAVTAVTRVWRERPALPPPVERTGGRPRRKGRLAPGAERSQTVEEVVASLPRRQWQRLRVGAGAKGPRLDDWAHVRVIESRDDWPASEVWLLARRSVSRPDELAYSLALAPHHVALQQLAQVAGTRYTVAQGIEEAKGETGFDHDAVRLWPSWYRHITLTMLAHAWLADQRQQEGGKSGTRSGGADSA